MGSQASSGILYTAREETKGLLDHRKVGAPGYYRHRIFSLDPKLKETAFKQLLIRYRCLVHVSYERWFRQYLDVGALLLLWFLFFYVGFSKSQRVRAYGVLLGIFYRVLMLQVLG